MSRQNLTRAALALTWTALAAPAALADETSEKAAADLLHRKLKNESPQDKALLDAVKGRDVVVVRGVYDHIEQILATARIKHTVVEPAQVAGLQLRNDQILMVNCPGEIGPRGIDKIQKFVRAGGLLYTTDWALANVVQKAFPKTISHNGGSTGDEVVPVVVDRSDDNLMSKMLLTQKTEPQWWLEGSSYPIRILDKEKVEVLAHSTVMGKRYGATPVVVRFRWEDGEVIHVVSHFYRQAQTKGPAVAAAKAAPSFDGLSDADKKAFAASPEAQAAKLGDVESSYAFQKMTTNLVVGKQRRNEELDRAYNMTVPAAAPLRASGGAGAASTATVAPGARMKVLGKKDGQVQVRDDSGNEGWLSEEQVIAR